MNKPFIAICYHCGNRTPHRELSRQIGSLVYEHYDDHKFEEPFHFVSMACGTCEGLTIFGGYQHEIVEDGSDEIAISKMRRLFPQGPEAVQPPLHTVTPSHPIPKPIIHAYVEAWPLRHINPTAFANQIRRALEYVCKDKGATGKTLAAQLKDLSQRSVFPEELASIGELLRQLGNIGSHATDQRVDMWDAELADELFRMIIQYVYLAPAHIQRMKERLSVQKVI
jgi:hypothetical protein